MCETSENGHSSNGIKFHVRLRRDSDSPLVEITPWVPALSNILVYETQSFPPGSKIPIIEKKTMYWLSEDGTCGYFTVGMLKRVIHLLSSLGYEIEAIDSRDRKRYFPAPDWSVVPSLRAGQKETITAITKSDCGLIVCPTGFGKSFIIATLTMMYPTLKFLIVAPGIAETKNLYDRIIKLTDDVSLMNANSRGNPDSRIVVSTSKSFMRADLQHTDMFIFDEAHSCGNNKTTQDILDCLRGSRIFGFTATPSGRSDRSDMLIEAVFGQPLVNYSYEDIRKMGGVTPITVQIWDVPGHVESSKSKYGNALTQNKRRYYWNNPDRNNLIATLAKQVPEDEQVLIMVDTVEHLVRLGSLLPDFALICGINNNPEDEAKARRLTLTNRMSSSKAEYIKLTDEFAAGTIKKVISTFCWKQSVDFPQLSVLIRADGAKSPILGSQIPGRMSRLCPGKNTGILIDFADNFNPSANRRALARIKGYKKNGWSIDHRGEYESN